MVGALHLPVNISTFIKTQTVTVYIHKKHTQHTLKENKRWELLYNSA